MRDDGMKGINLRMNFEIVDKALVPEDFLAEKPSVFLTQVMMQDGPPKKKEGTIISTEK